MFDKIIFAWQMVFGIITVIAIISIVASIVTVIFVGAADPAGTIPYSWWVFSWLLYSLGTALGAAVLWFVGWLVDNV